MSNWFYDDESGRYVLKGARILFPNFSGEEQDYNQAGKRNFRLVLPVDMAEELKSRGVFVRDRPDRDNPDESIYLVKVGIYPDADIRLKFGGKLHPLSVNDFDVVDSEFRKGHVINGNLDVEFHVSRNTRVMTDNRYARVDTMIIPIRKSRLLDDYEDAIDDELPM